MAGIRTCRPLAPERSFLMAIDRHDNNGSAVDDAPAAGDPNASGFRHLGAGVGFPG